MGKHRKPTEEKHGAPGHAAGNPQVVPVTGAELDPELEQRLETSDDPGTELDPELEQRLETSDDPGTEGVELPELWGFGVERGAGGWLAYRVSNRGKVEILNPMRRGEISGEQRHTALARMQTAIKHAYAAPQKRGE